jgi:serine/threonine protein kinase
LNAPQTFDEVLDRVADGGPIDWDAAERLAHSPEQSAMLRNLRILAELHATHLDESVTTPAPDAAANDLLETSLPEGVEAEPTRWGQYQLVRRIGEGHFGVVYLARDEHLAREVAIKLLHGRVIDRQSVIAEGRALALVDHPNVLTVYGIEEHQGQLALCMKYIRGRTLEDIVRTDGPMNADEALVVARAVCSAVAAVHAAGVLHRDIKARNVMRERQGRYVLMDFGAGVPQAPDGSSSDETTIGTPLYMAPELLERRPASRRSDVYAIGVLLYFLVTGEYPVAGRTTADIVAAHRAGRRTRLDERRTDLPPSYVRAVDRATSPVLAERPESAAALLRVLTPDEPPAPAPPLWRRSPRSRDC